MANNVKHPQINLLLTRPQAGSDVFWHALPQKMRQSLSPIFSPLIKIVPLDPCLQPIHTAIFSSVNGVAHAPAGQGRVAYCVGKSTTNAAMLAGWRAIQMGETADQVVANLLGQDDTGPLTHFAGRHTRGDIAGRLSITGREVEYVSVYDQEIKHLNEEAIEALSSNFPLFTPLFSPRTARAFKDQNKGQAPLHIVVLSQEVADQLGDMKLESLTMARRPTRSSMLDAVEKAITQVTLG